LFHEDSSNGEGKPGSPPEDSKAYDGSFASPHDLGSDIQGIFLSNFKITNIFLMIKDILEEELAERVKRTH